MTSPTIETDRVGLTWLATVRWTTLVAAVGAVVAGRSGVDTTASLTPALSVLAIAALVQHLVHVAGQRWARSRRRWPGG
jgi:1,4-dihydroxy-2-naphthoate octaprenyltransferase